MRGFLMEVATSVENTGNLTANDFACTRDGSSFAEWYEDEDRDTVLNQMQPVADKHGFVYGKEDGVPYVAITQEAKNSWFMDRYKKFMEKAKDMTIEGFASGAADTCQREIEDTYGDAVYLAGEEYAVTLDGFIRQAEPGEKYYIGNVIAMH